MDEVEVQAVIARAEAHGFEEIRPVGESIGDMASRIADSLLRSNREIADALVIVDTIDSVTISSPSTHAAGGMLLSVLRTGLAATGSAIKPLSSQLQQARSAVSLKVNPYKEKISAAADELEARMLRYTQQIEDMREREQKERESNPPPPASEGEPPPLDSWVAPLPKSMNLGDSTLYERSDWEVEVTDVAAVPDEFKTVDTAAALASWRKNKKPIAGLNFFQKKSLVTRRKG